MGRGGVAVATVMGTVQVQKSVQCCLQLCSKQVGPGGVAISTPVEGGTAGNGGIAIAGAQGSTLLCNISVIWVVKYRYRFHPVGQLTNPNLAIASGPWLHTQLE